MPLGTRIAMSMTAILLGGGWPATNTAAQIATPIASPPSSCVVSPRGQKEVELVLDGTVRPSATAFVEVPQGIPADDKTIRAIVALEMEFAGCLNAGDWPRWLALLSEDEIRSSIAREEVGELFAGAGTPIADGEGEGDSSIAAVAVEDVRLLPDGRVRAVVVWTGEDRGMDRMGLLETNLHLYRSVDGRWLRDAEIENFVMNPSDIGPIPDSGEVPPTPAP